MQAHVTVSIAKSPGALARVLYGLRRLGVNISRYQLIDESPTSRQVQLDVGHSGLNLDAVRAALDTLDGVMQVRELRPLDARPEAAAPDLSAALDAIQAASGAHADDHDVERVVSHARLARAWLAGLPVHDPAATALRMAWLIRQPGLSATEPGKRLKFLERCRETVAGISRLPAAAALDPGLPLPRRARGVLDAASDLNLHFAAAYARLFEDEGPALNQRRSARGRGVLALIAHRALFHYTECLRLRYAGYRSAPQGIWLRIHRIFAKARSSGLLDAGVMDMFGQINLHSNVLHAYKRALLLGLCNPYQCSPGDIDRVCELADHWGAEAQLVPAGSRNGNTRFYIDPDADRAGIAWQKDSDGDSATLALRTRRLLRVLDEAHSAAPDAGKVRRAAAPEDDRLLLEHLLWSWHGGRERALPREAFEGDLAMVCGLGASAQAVSGNLLEPAAGDAEAEDEEVPGWAARVHHDAEPVCHPNVLDDSVTGMHVLVRAQRTGAMRVGDVVALRRDGADGWVVAVVRWTRQLDGGEIDTGLFKLGAGACAVDMAIARAGASAGHAVPALRLPPLPAGGRKASLVTQRTAYHHGARLELSGPSGLAHARAGRLLLMTRQAAWFELDGEG